MCPATGALDAQDAELKQSIRCMDGTQVIAMDGKAGRMTAGGT